MRTINLSCNYKHYRGGLEKATNNIFEPTLPLMAIGIHLFQAAMPSVGSFLLIDTSGARLRAGMYKGSSALIAMKPGRGGAGKTICKLSRCYVGCAAALGTIKFCAARLAKFVTRSIIRPYSGNVSQTITELEKMALTGTCV
jgi:hypothetical protein